MLLGIFLFNHEAKSKKYMKIRDDFSPMCKIFFDFFNKNLMNQKNKTVCNYMFTR